MQGTSTEHVMGPLIGADSLGWRSTCSCGHEVASSSRSVLRDLHEQHLVEVARPELRQAARRGLDRARGALAETIARGKHTAQETSA